MVNVNKLKGKIVENGLTINEVADMIGIDRSTLYRKIGNNCDTLSIKEANKIVEVLKLTCEEAVSIFFASNVA